MFRAVSPATVKSMLADGAELALIDVREELIFSKSHLLWARNVPLSRIELRFARLVPRLTTRIVLCDGGDCLVKRAAAILASAGYTDLSYLDGGVAAWERAGFVLFSGVHVPSKAFGEFVEHDSRTPSIIGAQSLINAGITNKVVALRNGTMGWHLAGFTCESRKSDRAPNFSEKGLAWAKSAAKAVAGKFDVGRVDRTQLEAWLNDQTRTTYIFDVRDPPEYTAGHYPGAISAPGGQLVQATDIYAATLGARVVLSDDKEVRALMTASWLKQMGWQEVFVLPEAGNETGEPEAIILGIAAADRAIDPSAVIEIDDVSVIDLSRSPDYRRGHIPGAWFAIRSRLNRALPKIAPTGEVILTSEDGVLARLAVAEAQALTQQPVHWLKGGNAAWTAAGFPPSTSLKMADEPVDVWLKPYEQPHNTEAAMSAYLSWEVDLLERIKEDGTMQFLHSN